MVNKGGCVLISKDLGKIALVYRKRRGDYSFPKGHLEEGENLQECALRETEEETGRKCQLLRDKPLGIIKYENDEGDIYTYMFLAKDLGETNKSIQEEDKEEIVWVDIDSVEAILSYQNLKDFWKEVKETVIETKL